LLRGKAGGEVLGGIVATERVGDLRVGEDAPEEPLLVALHQTPDPGDLDHVDADPHDHAGSSLRLSLRPPGARQAMLARMRSRTARTVAGDASIARQLPPWSPSASTVTVMRVTRSAICSTRTVTRSATRSTPVSSGSGARSARVVSMRPLAARASACSPKARTVPSQT